MNLLDSWMYRHPPAFRTAFLRQQEGGDLYKNVLKHTKDYHIMIVAREPNARVRLAAGNLSPQKVAQVVRPRGYFLFTIITTRLITAQSIITNWIRSGKVTIHIRLLSVKSGGCISPFGSLGITTICNCHDAQKDNCFPDSSIISLSLPGPGKERIEGMKEEIMRLISRIEDEWILQQIIRFIRNITR